MFDLGFTVSYQLLRVKSTQHNIYLLPPFIIQSHRCHAIIRLLAPECLFAHRQDLSAAKESACDGMSICQEGQEATHQPPVSLPCGQPESGMDEIDEKPVSILYKNVNEYIEPQQRPIFEYYNYINCNKKLCKQFIKYHLRWIIECIFYEFKLYV